MLSRIQRFPRVLLRGASALLLVVALCWPRVASAWVETHIDGATARVELQRDGSALVAWELRVVLRGGPLQSFEINGADVDAEPVGEGTVHHGASEAGTGLQVARREDGTLVLTPAAPAGLNSGSYQLRYRYRTQLMQRGWIQREGRFAAVRWVSPRFGDGIDSFQVTFVVPTAPLSPRLPSADDGSDGKDSDGGIFLSELQRTGSVDELLLTRPHVARGEPVVWRVLVDGEALGAAMPPVQSASQREAAHAVAGTTRENSLWQILSAALAGAWIATLLWLKWRWMARRARDRQATVEGWLRLPLALRLLAVMATTMSLVLVSWASPSGLLGPAGGLVVMALLALRFRSRRSPLRGPGHWFVVSPADAFQRDRRGSGLRWFDASAPLGLAALALAVAVPSVVALALGAPTVRAVQVGMLAAVVLPLFCLGRDAELIPHGHFGAVAPLRPLYGRLQRELGSQIVPWVRIPRGATAPDELRLLIRPRHAVRGLLAVEVGMEYFAALGAQVPVPVVVVRVREGSEAQARFGHSVLWTRGRKPQERVALLRPKLPVASVTLALVRSVLRLGTERGAERAGGHEFEGERLSAAA